MSTKEEQKCRLKLDENLNILRGQLSGFLGYKESDISISTDYQENKYVSIIQINYKPENDEHKYKCFEIKGEYIPRISQLEHGGEFYDFFRLQGLFKKFKSEL